jgi:hypothetical protein
VPEAARPADQEDAGEVAKARSMALKTLEELTARRTAWGKVRTWISQAGKRVQVLPADNQSSAATLLALQISTATPLGALADQTGGLLVDSGWLRILGSGHERMPWGLAEWNGLQADHQPVPDKLILAHDVLGGFFAREHNKKISYFSPDSLKWENTQLGYKDWLAWALSEEMGDFYEHFRWRGWAKEVAALEPQQGLLVQPYLWEDGPTLARRKRLPVNIIELWGRYQESSA